ncbi:uncharacterized protein BDV17DRAFT_295484 [Aspergillus undulatus]|uniref:uncharacterized protein n=1 Tax=Aspergillus undulatus TaxID=1810928 RepID=UPI003CCD0C76
MSTYKTPVPHPYSERDQIPQVTLSKPKLICLTKIPKPEKHDEAKAIDIVAVHGLTPWESRSKSEDGSPSLFWLRDFIPKDIRGARVLTFNYDVNALWNCGELHGSLREASRVLLSELARVRESVPASRPLVYICHGFGGFIIESCLNDALMQSSSPFPDILGCAQGVIFLSTPQRTSPEILWAILLTSCARDNIPGLSPVELPQTLPHPNLEDLAWVDRSAGTLRGITESFKSHAVTGRMKMKVLSCYEDVPTSPQQVCSLTKHTAALGLKSEKVHSMKGCTHLSMARFSDREDENYKQIISAIKKMRKSAFKETEPGPTPIHAGSVPSAKAPALAQEVHSDQATNVDALSDISSLVGPDINSQSAAAKNTSVSPMPGPTLCRDADTLSITGVVLPQQPAQVQIQAHDSIKDASRASPPVIPQDSRPESNPSRMKIARRPVGQPPSRSLTAPGSKPPAAQAQAPAPVSYNDQSVTQIQSTLPPQIPRCHLQRSLTYPQMPATNTLTASEESPAYRATPLPLRPLRANANPNQPSHFLNAMPGPPQIASQTQTQTSAGRSIVPAQHSAPQPISTTSGTSQYPPAPVPPPVPHPPPTRRFPAQTSTATSTAPEMAMASPVHVASTQAPGAGSPRPPKLYDASSPCALLTEQGQQPTINAQKPAKPRAGMATGAGQRPQISSQSATPGSFPRGLPNPTSTGIGAVQGGSRSLVPARPPPASAPAPAHGHAHSRGPLATARARVGAGATWQGPRRQQQKPQKQNQKQGQGQKQRSLAPAPAPVLAVVPNSKGSGLFKKIFSSSKKRPGAGVGTATVSRHGHGHDLPHHRGHGHQPHHNSNSGAIGAGLGAGLAGAAAVSIGVGMIAATNASHSGGETDTEGETEGETGVETESGSGEEGSGEGEGFTSEEDSEDSEDEEDEDEDEGSDGSDDNDDEDDENEDKDNSDGSDDSDDSDGSDDDDDEDDAYSWVSDD